MRVLIVFANTINPQHGGVERVYANLTPFFREQGVDVYAYYFIESSFDDNHCYNGVYKGGSGKANSVFRDLRMLVSLWHITHVICGFPNHSLMKAAEMLSGVMVFHHAHNVPSVLFDTDQYWFFKCLRLNNFITKRLSHWYMHYKYLPVFKSIVRNNHLIVLLSEKFRDDLNSLFDIRKQNVISIPNPFLIDSGFQLKDVKKEKTLLYVGRLYEKQKNVSSLLRIWRILQEKLPEYKLIVVGDGPDRICYEIMAKELGLERCVFAGFQEPTEYYKTSSVLLMTSFFEGFGMVLVEAMQYGCVPFAYNSYASLTDIIKNGENGFSITPFDEKEYAERMENFLLSPEGYQSKVRMSAIETARCFDVRVIGQVWLNLFKSTLR